MQRYNGYPWPTNEADNPEPDYFGPDDRRAVLAELFSMQLDDVKQKPLEIEPPFYCDYVRPFSFFFPQKNIPPPLESYPVRFLFVVKKGW